MRPQAQVNVHDSSFGRRTQQSLHRPTITFEEWRIIMGGRYESLSANNKEEPEPSPWTESY
jgi:hypothetical protein